MASSQSQKPTLSQEQLEIIAQRFRVLGEPSRLRLLVALEEGEKNVSTLVNLTNFSQANVSKHLGILMTAGMVGRRKQGLNAFYFISDPQIFALCELMCHRVRDELATKLGTFSRKEKCER